MYLNVVDYSKYANYVGLTLTLDVFKFWIFDTQKAR